MRVHLVALAIIIAPAFCMGAVPAHPAEPTAVGLWEQIDVSTGKADGWFLVSDHDGLYDATLVKMFPKPGEDPHPICSECPGAQKDAPWLGLTIVKNMQRDELDYENGTILDPRDGSEYYARMRLSPDGQTLTVRGDLGIDPLGGDEAWRRLPDAALKQLDPATIAGIVRRRSGQMTPAPPKPAFPSRTTVVPPAQGRPYALAAPAGRDCCRARLCDVGRPPTCPQDFGPFT